MVLYNKRKLNFQLTYCQYLALTTARSAARNSKCVLRWTLYYTSIFSW